MLNSPSKELRVFFGEQFELIQGKDDKTLIFKFSDVVKPKEIREFFGLSQDQTPNTIKIKLISQLSRDNLVITLRSFEELIDLKDQLVLDKTLSTLAIESTTDTNRLQISQDDVQSHLQSKRLQRELFLLGKAHDQVESEKLKLSIMVNNLDGEITRSHFCRSY